MSSTKPIPPGKLPPDLLARLLGGLPPAPADVRLGPEIGEDACVLDVPAGVLVAATDPITLTTSDIGRYAVMVNANDVAVCGVRPRWFLAAVLLPIGTTPAAVEALFTTMRRALVEVGATLVGGHTEVTAAVTQPVIVGQMLGVSPSGRFVTTGGASAGDVVVQAGAVPIEGAAVLAAEAGDAVAALDPELVAAAAGGIVRPGISVVDAAIEAADLGATAMHDPTEGGLASGLHELAAASGLAVSVDRAAVRWFEPGVAVCQALGADAWATLASGSLLATFPPDVAEAAVAALTAPDRAVAAIGTMEAGAGVHDLDGTAVPWPQRDEVSRILDH